MAKDKYDIPYSMAPVKNGRKKKPRYPSYIQEQGRFINRFMSSPAKKLLAYIIFFAVFGTCLITAIRNSRNLGDEDYELDLEHSFSNSREQNFIDDSIIDNHNEQLLNDVDNNNIDDIDEIDILDSDDGEVAKLVDTPSQKKGKANSLKKQFKSSDDEFDQELDDLIASANEQLSKGKSNKNNNKNNNKETEGLKRDIPDDSDLIDKIDAIAAKKSGGRHGNAVKGESLL